MKWLKIKNKSNTLNLEKRKIRKKETRFIEWTIRIKSELIFSEDLRTLEEVKDWENIDNYRELGCENSDILEICSKIPSSNTFKP